MHSPKILKDPLVGGQGMVEALRRGNHMDLGQLSNVSKMTGGSGISEHEREAANLFAQQVGRGAQDYAGRKYDAKTDSRLSDAIAVEKVKGGQMRKTEKYKKILDVEGSIAESIEKGRPRGRYSLDRSKDEYAKLKRQTAGYQARHRAYKANKST